MKRSLPLLMMFACACSDTDTTDDSYTASQRISMSISIDGDTERLSATAPALLQVFQPDSQAPAKALSWRVSTPDDHVRATVGLRIVDANGAMNSYALGTDNTNVELTYKGVIYKSSSGTLTLEATGAEGEFWGFSGSFEAVLESEQGDKLEAAGSVTGALDLACSVLGQIGAGNTPGEGDSNDNPGGVDWQRDPLLKSEFCKQVAASLEP
jgi:hypothetical protein